MWVSESLWCHMGLCGVTLGTGMSYESCDVTLAPLMSCQCPWCRIGPVMSHQDLCHMTLCDFSPGLVSSASSPLPHYEQFFSLWVKHSKEPSFRNRYIISWFFYCQILKLFIVLQVFHITVIIMAIFIENEKKMVWSFPSILMFDVHF